MNSLKNTLMIAGAAVLFQAPFNSNAQDNHTPDLIAAERMIVRQDKVGADLNTPADKKSTEIYDRKVMSASNGAFEVAVTDKDGNIRMEGTYADADLTRAEGPFTYYYPNGNIESKGMYVNGMKSGTWHRYSADGTPKAERNYAGMTWEDMAVTLGLASKSGAN
jgi:hypothetical protein